MVSLRGRLFGGSSRPAPERSDDRPDVGLVGLRDARIEGRFNRDTGEVIPGFPVDPDDRVVDVGCGDGGPLNFCSLRGAEVIGIDIDDGALASASDRIAAHSNDRVTLHRGTAEELPVTDGWATRVICAEVLEHVVAPDAVMAELVRVAAPGALVLITVPDEVSEAIMGHAADPSYFREPNHVRIFTRNEFTQLVSDSGLEVLDHTTYGFFWTIWWGLFWGTGVELDDAHHPILDEWTRVWRDTIGRPEGQALKERLDRLVPKTQAIVARMPEETVMAT